MQSITLFNIFFILFLPFSNGATFTNESTLGQEFVFSFVNNFDGNSSLVVFISNNNELSIDVTITSIFPSFTNISFTLQGDALEWIEIEPQTIQARYCDYENPSMALVSEDKGIRIQTTLPVAVNAYNENLAKSTADSYTILPVDRLGTHYVAVGTVFDIQYPNVITAVAYEDDTMITIGSQQITINSLQVVTLAINDVISGIRVTGNKPFAAFSGSMAGAVLNTDRTDYAMTTLLPTTVWGTQFPLVPFMHVDNQQYQIIANTNGTIVNVNGEVYQLNADEYYMTITAVNTSILSSNFPIQLIQIGQEADSFGEDQSNVYGGLFFLQIPSVDQWFNMEVMFFPIHSDLEAVRLFIRIYTNSPGRGRIYMDGGYIDVDAYSPIAGSNLYYYETIVTDDLHYIGVQNTNIIFSVICYTYHIHTGSGFPVAYRLMPVNTMTSATMISNTVSTTIVPTTTTMAVTSRYVTATSRLTSNTPPTNIFTTTMTTTLSHNEAIVVIGSNIHVWLLTAAVIHWLREV